MVAPTLLTMFNSTVLATFQTKYSGYLIIRTALCHYNLNTVWLCELVWISEYLLNPVSYIVMSSCYGSQFSAKEEKSTHTRHDDNFILFVCSDNREFV